jgi:CarD family transcriptional regulator
MEYAVGQNIIHPAHGAGEVVDIENQELVEGFKKYYVIRFADKRLTVRVPFSHSEDAGLRDPISQEKIKQVLTTLRQLPKKLPKDYKKRRKQIEDKIFSGVPVQIAEAVRELTWRRSHKNLGIADQRLLDQGRELLIQELTIATDSDAGEIQQKIDASLAEALESTEDTPEN